MDHYTVILRLERESVELNVQFVNNTLKVDDSK